MILEKLGARQAAAPAGGGRGNFHTVRGEKATRGRGYRTQTRGPSTTFGLRLTSLLMNNFDAACSASYAVCGKGINWYPNLAASAGASFHPASIPGGLSLLPRLDHPLRPGDGGAVAPHPVCTTPYAAFSLLFYPAESGSVARDDRVFWSQTKDL